ncbi:tRNA (adenosine(37)-N6)-dimethylallyltransferase MiaA [Bythopirellula polymerisocia]|uniref:tRNA dimethylallyltransferase n=1 Tax=Bythopirellula polymerisocia TaxID=2528003 RepID=A0A5C6C2F7_9BACT|nr:tRNA (adenosine(37)-N6)-dimethylallyltransferase MiaA [Bythopirellula polymerisocia]TWU17841.1 IPP transferase [Bythopirellula polymerisocia]
MNDTQPALDCWFLSGATAVGKTQVALSLASWIGAEIISLDSMAVYRGMDIGTAKPTPEEQAQVPHHLIDVVDPSEEFSIERYLELAQGAMADIKSRGKEVLFVGGTPLYLKALLRGMSSGPPADWQVREQIAVEVKEVGSEELHRRLEQLDPLAASQIHPHDTRRLIRALEVFRSTGEPISHQQTHFDEGTPADECRVFILRRPREEQHERINERVEQMFERGLVDEVERLTAKGNKLGRTASQAVGYREVIEYLSGGEYNEMVEKIKAHTRRFAKRQGTWFRSLCECRYVDIEGEIDPEAIAKQIATI